MKRTKRLLIILAVVLTLLAGLPGWSGDGQFQKASGPVREDARHRMQVQYADAFSPAYRQDQDRPIGNPLSEANELYRQVIRLREQGRFAEAIPPNARVLAIFTQVLGPEHPYTIVALNDLASMYSELGDHGSAEPLLRHALAVRERILGPEHPHTALSLSNLALLYWNMGANEKAEPLYRRALTIREKVLGPEHPDTALAISSLAGVYSRTGDYDKAEQLFLRSLAIVEQTAGPDHPQTAVVLSGLSALYLETGAYSKAEGLLRRALTIREKALGPEHPVTADSLHNLARLYESMDADDKVEPLLRRSFMIYEKSRGPEHPNTARSLNALAAHYYKMGAYDKAEPLYKRSLEIHEKALGPDHPSTANALNNLAAFYSHIGAQDKAEPLYRRTLIIREKALGPDHPATAAALSNLAAYYINANDYGAAEPLLRRTLAIREKALGPEHPETAMALGNLAPLYMAAGDYGKAESLYRRSLEINEKAMGPNHSLTAASLNTMAVYYYKMGTYNKAEPLFKRALEIREKTLGPDHPETATILGNLASLYTIQGKHDKALALMERVQGIDRRQIGQIIGFAAERQQTQFLTTREGALFTYFSLIRQSFADRPKAVRNALDVWLVRKGILLENQKRIQDALAAGGSPQSREIFAKLTAVRLELEKLILGGPGRRDAQAHQKRIADLSEKKETLEGQLSRLSQTFAQQQKTRIATSRDVASALPKGAVLVEMARIRDLDIKLNRWGGFRYLAFILPAGKGSDVSLVDLGGAYTIDMKVEAFKKFLGNSDTPPDVLAGLSADLYRTIFSPLRLALGESRRIFLSPDGSLNLIPFEVLRDDQGRYLIETHALHYVSAGRDIAGYGMIKEQGRKALLMGDPDFDLAASQVTEAGGTFMTRSRQMQGITFPRLPETKKEVEDVAAILGRNACDTYTGEAASESVLMQSQSPRILHLATHGFFLSDQDWSSMMDENTRGIAIAAKETPAAKKAALIENPFLRSGLALAGANRTLSQDGSNEGIMTAEKILGLNLRGTDLVVLSACETGVGEVKNGEGVYGLRRAFTQAGAKSLVMSLWAVPDRETKELMVTFYRNMQSGKMNRAEALRQAALKQQQTVKARYGNDNPYYWGSFIFLGEAD
jgi:CHAT domain-containing protein/tetratricopeptide (TPR) repeat protein